MPHLQHRYAHDVAPLERRIRGDIDALDCERPVEPDPSERAMRLLAEVAACPLVERDAERRCVVGAQPHEREAAPKVPPKHR